MVAQSLSCDGSHGLLSQDFPGYRKVLYFPTLGALDLRSFPRIIESWLCRWRTYDTSCMACLSQGLGSQPCAYFECMSPRQRTLLWLDDSDAMLVGLNGVGVALSAAVGAESERD